MANSKHQTRQISSLFFLFLSVRFFLFPWFFLLDLLLLAAILPFGLRFVLGFFPRFFLGFFSRFLGLDGFHCVLQASSLICIVLLHVGPQKVVVSQAMLHAKTQHLPQKQNDNTYFHKQCYMQKRSASLQSRTTISIFTSKATSKTSVYVSISINKLTKRIKQYIYI